MLSDLAKTGLEISMSMYGGFEQVGSIGSSIARDDKQTTTEPGDITNILSNGDVTITLSVEKEESEK